jgi:lipopolysaccharide export system protein LptA
MKRLKQLLALSSLVGLTALIPSAQAQIATGPNNNGPIDVTADKLEMVDAEHLAIWRGNVEAVQNGSRLVADTVNVYFAGKSAAPAKPTAAKSAPGSAASVGQDWGAVQRMVAEGHVFFVSQDQTARGEHAVYELEPDTITMTGDVVVVQGDNVVKGDKLVIQVKTGHADIISNATGRNKPERVRGVFYNGATPAPGAPAAAKP